MQGATRNGRNGGNGIAARAKPEHPIEIFARAYGLEGGDPDDRSTNARSRRADIIPLRGLCGERSELRKSLIAGQEESPGRSRARSRPSTSRITTRCGTRCTKCCTSRRAARTQIAGELEAYNPLIPQGGELIATLMLEIEDPVRRDATLKQLAGIEESVSFDVDGARVKGTPTEYEDRTTPDGKTSSVHWVRFVFTPEQKKQFIAATRAWFSRSNIRTTAIWRCCPPRRAPRRPRISRAPSSSPTLVMARLVRATQLKSGPCTKNLARIPVIIQTSPGGPHSRAMTL